MHQTPLSARPVPLWRHLAAMFYDSFLLIACWFAVAFLFSIFSRGEAITGGALLYALRITLIIVWSGFFVYFWSRQGQTLGMRAWRVIIVTEDGTRVHALRALGRFFLALLTCLPFGLGLWWRFWDKKNRTLYDIGSKTRLFTVATNPYPSTKKGKKHV